MNRNSDISSVYLIGIGGIGMSALARYFLARGVRVSGYDRAATDNTAMLEEEGASIQFSDDLSRIDKNAGLVIYTPAISEKNLILTWYKQNGFDVKKRSEVLGEITYGCFNICIAGTHGKTTMSVMTAHILRHTGYGCNAFLGGISANYGTNYWHNDNNVNVIEADEYDRSFLKLRPDIALISAMDSDHLDVYGDLDKMSAAFFQFAGLIKDEGGLLITRFGVDLEGSVSNQHLTYSLQNPTANCYASDIVMSKGGYRFDFNGPEGTIPGLKLQMGGMHNVENMVASIAIAKHLEIDDEKISAAVAEFKGVHRRFEYVIGPADSGLLTKDVVLIDDYAHHPEELRALLRGARSLFNNRWITVIFQPHLYSRTRDFYKEFASALSIANTVVLTPIYPAREEPIEGVTSKLIADDIQGGEVSIMNKEQLVSWLKDDFIKALPRSLAGDVLIVAGAGDIDKEVISIAETLKNELRYDG